MAEVVHSGCFPLRNSQLFLLVAVLIRGRTSRGTNEEERYGSSSSAEDPSRLLLPSTSLQIEGTEEKRHKLRRRKHPSKLPSPLLISGSEMVETSHHSSEMSHEREKNHGRSLGSKGMKFLDYKAATF